MFQRDGVAFLQVFTEKSAKGDKFRIPGNIGKCLTKCVPDGKMTIELVEPRVQLMLSKADPEKLRQLISGLKKGLAGESLIGTGLLSSATTKPTKIGRTTKLRILSRDDYRAKIGTKGFPNELIEFYANGLGLRSIDTRLFRLKLLTTLDLTRNALKSLNAKLGQLKLQVRVKKRLPLRERGLC